jgi:iron complex transport system ATP-binding protein
MKFGDLEILSAVDLCASAGEVVGLMGAGGVGKSTLLRICAGLLLPASGTALVQSSSKCRRHAAPPASVSEPPSPARC